MFQPVFQRRNGIGEGRQGVVGGGDGTAPAPFGHALAKIAEERPEIVGLTADLGKYTDLHIFAQKHPERFYQMGMAEQLLISAAAGMAREGFQPFATTYAVFAARRAYPEAWIPWLTPCPPHPRRRGPLRRSCP